MHRCQNPVNLSRTPTARALGASSAPASKDVLAHVLDASDHTLNAAISHGLDHTRTCLLKVLVFSYASGVYCSEDIADALVTHPELRWLAAGSLFSAQEIRSFRRRNRTLITQCLAETLRSQSAAVFAPSHPILAVRSSGYVCRSLDRWQRSRDGSNPDADAERRLDCAVRCDSAALDC